MCKKVLGSQTDQQSNNSEFHTAEVPMLKNFAIQIYTDLRTTLDSLR